MGEVTDKLSEQNFNFNLNSTNLWHATKKTKKKKLFGLVS